MTREEAIKYWEEFLSEIPYLLKNGFSKEEAVKQEEACKLVIEALQERPHTLTRTTPPSWHGLVPTVPLSTQQNGV